MNSESYSRIIQVDWDPETIDEMSYDETSASNILDKIYDSTKNNKLFQKLYEIAAAKMISTNLDIGLAVCMSYDYFKFFYPCLLLYMKDPEQLNESSAEYISFIKKLD
jgi:hypothetical protein